MDRPLTDIDIYSYATKLQIKHFRGVFMRDNLPKRAYARESAIINLDDYDGPGTHWVAYWKDDNVTHYFDSYGNLQPPKELINYLGSISKILYNYNQYQEYGSIICGQLCLIFLYQMSNE